MTHTFNHSRWEQERKARMGRVEGWRTIDSAPKDGTWVILGGTSEIEMIDEYNPALHDYGTSAGDLRMAICRYQKGSWRDQWDDYYGPEYPSHWMPIPQPPQG